MASRFSLILLVATHAAVAVEELTAENFGLYVAGKNALVMFSVPWCKPCVEYLPKYAEAEKELVQSIPDLFVGYVDCERFAQFRAWFQIDDFPDVKLFTPTKKEPVSYPNEWKKEQMITWVKQQYGMAPPPPSQASRWSKDDQMKYGQAMQSMIASMSSSAAASQSKHHQEKVHAAPYVLEQTIGSVPGTSAKQLTQLTSTLGPVLGFMNKQQQVQFWNKIIPTGAQSKYEPMTDAQMRAEAQDMVRMVEMDHSEDDPTFKKEEMLASDIAAEEQLLGADDGIDDMG